MTMWIIMGSLVGLITIFLIVMSVKDRKKEKKRKAELAQKEIKMNNSVKNVIIFLREIYLFNENLVKDFRPSIGKLKMGEIKTLTKKIMKFYKTTQEYEYAKEGATLIKLKINFNKKIINIYNEFIKQSSSIWSKKMVDQVSYLNKEISKMPEEFVAAYTKDVRELIKGHTK